MIDIVYVDINNLRFCEYNPRKWSDKAIKNLKESIEKFGLVDPIIVNKAKGRENIIIGGHFRVKIAKDLGIKKVPVVYVNIPDIQKEKELNLRLNKNLGEWDTELLAEFDEDLLVNVGFDFSELKKIKVEIEKIQVHDNWEFNDGVVRVFVKIGDIDGEIDYSDYKKFKELIKKKGGIEEYIKEIINGK